jgi:hypothetical protein
MTYSKIHQKFSKYLKQPDALTHPAKYLGPNYQDVLNFWIYVDTLSYEENEKMEDRYYALDDVRVSAILAAKNAAKAVVGEDFRRAAWNSACDVTGWGSVFSWATYELIAHHKLLEQNKTLMFIRLYTKQP